MGKHRGTHKRPPDDDPETLNTLLVQRRARHVQRREGRTGVQRPLDEIEAQVRRDFVFMPATLPMEVELEVDREEHRDASSSHVELIDRSPFSHDVKSTCATGATSLQSCGHCRADGSSAEIAPVYRV